MYKQLDFSKNYRNLTDDFFSLLADGALEDVSRTAQKPFLGCDLPYFPFLADIIGSGTGKFDVEIVAKSPIEKPKAPNVDKLARELERCRKAADSLCIGDEWFGEALDNLIYEVSAEIREFPKHYSGGFEEIYNSVLNRINLEYADLNNSIKMSHWREMVETLKAIFKVHREVCAAKPQKIFGKYFPTSQRIELYKDTIESEFDNDRDRTDFLLCVFAHELFHKWHYGYIMSKGGKLSRGKKAKAVKESLARRFEYIYACNSRLIGEPARQKVVKMTNPTLSLFPDNPYHGAQYIDNNCFGAIVKLSVVNMSDAFGVLNAMYLVGECNN